MSTIEAQASIEWQNTEEILFAIGSKDNNCLVIIKTDAWTILDREEISFQFDFEPLFLSEIKDSYLFWCVGKEIEDDQIMLKLDWFHSITDFGNKSILF